MSDHSPGPDRHRIAYLINQYPKISHTFIRNEIAALEQNGFDVLRIAIRGWDAELLDPADVAEQAATAYVLRTGLRESVKAALKTLLSSPIRTLKALWRTVRLSIGSDRSLPYHLTYLAEACLVRQWTERHGSRHVHAHFGTNAAEVAMLVNELGGPLFSFTVHGPEEFDKPYQIKLREKIRAASFVVGVSSFGRSQLYRYAEADDWQKIHVVHCGLGDDYLGAGAAGFTDAPTLVCVGRLCEQKGQLVLVRACGILAARGVDFRVVLVGDGEMRAEVEREIGRDGRLGKRVTISGWRSSDAIRAMLTSSRGLVLPSLAEGLPVVIMEAMSLGRPVISTYIAGIPELVRDGSEGFLVFASSETDLADAMEKLLTLEAPQFDAMAARARVRVVERHTAITEAAKLGRLFRKAMALPAGD